MIKVGDYVYYARVHPKIDIYEVLELKVRTSTPKYFVGVDKRTKQSHLFSINDYGKIIYKNRADCLDYVKKIENTYTNEK